MWLICEASLEVVASLITIICCLPCLIRLFQYVIVASREKGEEDRDGEGEGDEDGGEERKRMSLRTSFRKLGIISILLPSLSFPLPYKDLKKGMRSLSFLEGRGVLSMKRNTI